MEDKHIFLFGVIGLVALGSIFAMTVLMKTSDNAITGNAAFNRDILNFRQQCGSDLQYFGLEIRDMYEGDCVSATNNYDVCIMIISENNVKISVKDLRGSVKVGTIAYSDGDNVITKVINSVEILSLFPINFAGEEDKSVTLIFSPLGECAQLKQQVCSR